MWPLTGQLTKGQGTQIYTDQKSCFGKPLMVTVMKAVAWVGAHGCAPLLYRAPSDGFSPSRPELA